MTRTASIKLQNIPHLNLREQFHYHYHFVTGGELAEELEHWRERKKIRSRYITWYYWPTDFLTYLTQMAVVGLESFTCGAVYTKLGMQGRLRENLKYVHNPYSLPGGGGTASKYFVRLPSLVSPEIALDKMHPALWAHVQAFYKNVRNPIFHGMQFANNEIDDVKNVFELLADIYTWIDEWNDLEQVLKGTSWVTRLNRPTDI